MAQVNSLLSSEPDARPVVSAQHPPKLNAMSEELATKVIGIIARVQRIPVESVTLDRTFEELRIDSLDGINIIFAIEEDLRISVPDEAAREIRTVRAMVEGIERLLVESRQGSGH